MKHTIELFIQGNSWVARHSDPQLKTLFGTDTIPTSFTRKALPETVLNAVKSLNPDRVVTVRSSL